MKGENTMSEKQNHASRSKMPNGVLILFTIILLAGLLSYIIPAGEFSKTLVNGKEVIDPDSFHFIASNHVSFIDLFLAIPLGLQNAIMLITMILMIGGAVNVFEQTGAIGGAIAASIRALGSKNKEWVLIVLTTFFACLGAFPAMLEAMIPFAPICIAVALTMGYDLLVGMSIPVVGAVIGWTSGVTNPYTTGIGHNMAGLPLFSGFLYRLLFFLILLFMANAFIVRYARKIEKNPSASLVADIPVDEKLKMIDVDSMPFDAKHKLIMFVFAATIATIVAGTVLLKWDMNKMSAFYIIGALIGGLIAGFGPNKIVETIIAGSTAIFPAAFAVGVARGISVLMTNSKIIDTIVYYLSLPLSQLGPVISAALMVLVQTLINFFIPSGSGQAMATLPIMLPLGHIIGVGDQVTILAFQIGDGLSNLIYPTVPLVVAYLAFTKIPFTRWFKYIYPFALQTMALGIAFTVVGVLINWQ